MPPRPRTPQDLVARHAHLRRAGTVAPTQARRTLRPGMVGPARCLLSRRFIHCAGLHSGGRHIERGGLNTRRHIERGRQNNGKWQSGFRGSRSWGRLGAGDLLGVSCWIHKIGAFHGHAGSPGSGNSDCITTLSLFRRASVHKEISSPTSAIFTEVFLDICDLSGRLIS